MRSVWDDLQRWAAVLAVALFAALASAPAHADVLDEAAQPGGSFSGDFAAPTPVRQDQTAVVGTGTQNAHDFLRFEALRPGAQTLTVTINRDPSITQGGSSGGEVYFSETAFLYAWDGTSAGRFRVNRGRPSATIEIALSDGFAGGQLDVALYFTDGRPVIYEIAAPTNDYEPPLPPPPGAGVFGPGDAPGGAFSTRWNAPTPIGPGYDAVEGEGSSGNSLFFVFNDLPPGVQTLTLEFSYPDDALPLYWAGGTVLARENAPFRWNWDGTTIGNFAINPLARTQTMTLTTSAGFGGELHVGLYFTYGARVSFRINVPSNGVPVGLPEVQAQKSVRVIHERGQGCATIGGAGPAAPLAAIPGACVEFVIAARNSGNGAATDIAIVDLLNTNLIFVAAQASGFDGPAARADFRLPAVNTDCATGSCQISLRNGHLAPGTGGRIVIRTLLK